MLPRLRVPKSGEWNARYNAYRGRNYEIAFKKCMQYILTCRQAEYEQSPPSVCSFCQLQRTERVGVAQCRLVGRPVSPEARSCERNVRSKRHLFSPSAKNVIDEVRASERATRRVLGMPARTSSAWIRLPFPGKYVFGRRRWPRREQSARGKRDRPISSKKTSGARRKVKQDRRQKLTDSGPPCSHRPTVPRARSFSPN